MSVTCYKIYNCCPICSELQGAANKKKNERDGNNYNNIIRCIGKRFLGKPVVEKKTANIIFLYDLGPTNSHEYLLRKRLVILLRNFTVIRSLTSLSKPDTGLLFITKRLSVSLVTWHDNNFYSFIRKRCSETSVVSPLPANIQH